MRKVHLSLWNRYGSRNMSPAPVSETEVSAYGSLEERRFRALLKTQVSGNSLNGVLPDTWRRTNLEDQSLVIFRPCWPSSVGDGLLRPDQLGIVSQVFRVVSDEDAIHFSITVFPTFWRWPEEIEIQVG